MKNASIIEAASTRQTTMGTIFINLPTMPGISISGRNAATVVNVEESTGTATSGVPLITASLCRASHRSSLRSVLSELLHSAPQRPFQLRLCNIVIVNGINQIHPRPIPSQLGVYKIYIGQGTHFVHILRDA